MECKHLGHHINSCPAVKLCGYFSILVDELDAMESYLDDTKVSLKGINTVSL